MSAARAVTVIAHWQMPEAAVPEVRKRVAARIVPLLTSRQVELLRN